MPVEFFFPKTFYYKDELITEEANERLVEAVHLLRQEFTLSTRSNLYTTYGTIPNILTQSPFKDLHKMLIDEINFYLNILETRPNVQYRITDSWISISSPSNYERMHTHDGAYISGVYYLKTAPECGDIIFETLSDNLWASARTKPENFNSVSYTSKDRRLILFNSMVPHSVGQNLSAHERIALSFNVAIL
ncbi:hypothetical protein KO02_13550 [Sphingobacterium sp. ML3W]|uniref:TIGR02466 family protein n=1 Tax=Sphingobacterium sp. ML3W TaxID=1538644 RepID=UPI0004F66575|nr:TIGR02466 family protein [Sphingobacterium sp. ML3W]AIM37593.1 hypothetical protein KO02_13550 [Sphingobacterium sp. ML3W]